MTAERHVPFPLTFHQRSSLTFPVTVTDVFTNILMDVRINVPTILFFMCSVVCFPFSLLVPFKLNDLGFLVFLEMCFLQK